MFRKSRKIAKQVKGISCVCKTTGNYNYKYLSQTPDFPTGDIDKNALERASKSVRSSSPKENPSQKYGVDFARIWDDGYRPPTVSEPWSPTISEDQTDTQHQQAYSPIYTASYSVDYSKTPSESNESEKGGPTNWTSSKNTVDSTAYFDKSPVVNWTPLIKYCSCSFNSGGSEQENPVQVNPHAWIPPPQAYSASPTSYHYFPGSYNQYLGNWKPPQHYFAPDFSQMSSYRSGYADRQVPGCWTEQYRVNLNQPADGSSGWSQPPQSDGNNWMGQKQASNPKQSDLYNERKYSSNLPLNNTELEFERVGAMPTGIFRCHTDECLGPAAQKNGSYQNPEYFAFHDMSYYDMHVLLRDHRLPSPKTTRKP